MRAWNIFFNGLALKKDLTLPSSWRSDSVFGGGGGVVIISLICRRSSGSCFRVSLYQLYRAKWVNLTLKRSSSCSSTRLLVSGRKK